MVAKKNSYLYIGQNNMNKEEKEKKRGLIKRRNSILENIKRDI